jgi:hypothetical protein
MMAGDHDGGRPHKMRPGETGRPSGGQKKELQ